MWLYHAFPFSQELIHTSHRGTSWALCAQIVWRNAPTKSWKRCDGAVCSGSTVQPWVVKKQLTVIRLTLVSGSLLQHKLQCNLSPFSPANPMIWVWINTYKNTIFRGFFTSINPNYFGVHQVYQGFDSYPYLNDQRVDSAGLGFEAARFGGGPGTVSSHLCNWITLW